MTTQEAIDILDHNWTKVVNPDYTDEELGKVLDMAIRSLEAWEKVKEAIKNAQENIPESYHTYSYWRGLEQALDIVKIFDKHLKEVEHDR